MVVQEPRDRSIQPLEALRGWRPLHRLPVRHEARAQVGRQSHGHAMDSSRQPHPHRRDHMTDPVLLTPEEEFLIEAKIAAIEPPEAIPDAAELPDDVRDGDIEEASDEALLPKEEA